MLFKPDRWEPLSNIHLTGPGFTLFSVDMQRRTRLKIFFKQLNSGTWKHLECFVFTLSWNKNNPESSMLLQKNCFWTIFSVTNQCRALIFKMTFEEDAKTAESAFNDNIIICEVVAYLHLFDLCWLPSGSVGEVCDVRIITTVKYRRNTFQLGVGAKIPFELSPVRLLGILDIFKEFPKAFYHLCSICFCLFTYLQYREREEEITIKSMKNLFNMEILHVLWPT